MKPNLLFTSLSRRFSATALLLTASSLTAFSQNAALLNGLVSYWPLDEIQGTRTPDKVSGYDLNLQNVLTGDLIAGQKGNAIRFDRTRSMMASRSNPATEDLPVGRQPNHTIAFWTQAATLTQNSLCFYAEGSTSSDTPFYNLRSDNRLAGGQQAACLLLAFRTNAGGSAILSRSAALPFDGLAWHQIVYTQSDNGDGTATRRVYIDGVEDLSTTGTGFPAKTATETYSVNTTAIGGLARTSNSGYITADIDEVAVWKRALSAAEVLDLKTNGLPAIGPPPAPLIINSFRADYPRVTAGRPVTLSWDVTKDGTLTIDPAPGDVTGLSSFGVGSVSVTPTEDTTYTLTLSRGLEDPLTATFTVSLLPDVAPGWDLLDTFEFRTPGLLNTQYPWRAGQWQVQTQGTTGNRIARTNGGEQLVGFPLASRSVALNQKATLFSRFLIPFASTGEIHQLFGLSDKTVRFGSDWLTNNGLVVRLFRPAGASAVVLQARNGPGSDWTDAALTITPGLPYNIWIDVENVPGVQDTYSVHAAPVGQPRSTVFENFLSDRLTTEVPFLGFPAEPLSSLVLATPVATQSAFVFQDDFFLSTGNAFNSTEPVPSTLTAESPPPPFELTGTIYDPTTGELLLQWNSTPGVLYTIEASPNMEEGSWVPILTDIASQGASTGASYTVPTTDRTRHFYRVIIP